METRYQAYIDNVSKLESILNGLSKEQMDYRISDEQWNIREIIAHLVDTEIQAYTRYRAILADDVPFFVNHNQDKWTRAFNHKNTDVNESLSTFKLMRQLNHRLISSLDESQLSLRGIHSVRGYVSVQELVERHITHLDKHIGQIDRNLRGKNDSQ